MLVNNRLMLNFWSLLLMVTEEAWILHMEAWILLHIGLVTGETAVSFVDMAVRDVAPPGISSPERLMTLAQASPGGQHLYMPWDDDFHHVTQFEEAARRSESRERRLQKPGRKANLRQQFGSAVEHSRPRKCLEIPRGLLACLRNPFKSPKQQQVADWELPEPPHTLAPSMQATVPMRPGSEKQVWNTSSSNCANQLGGEVPVPMGVEISKQQQLLTAQHPHPCSRTPAWNGPTQ